MWHVDIMDTNKEMAEKKLLQEVPLFLGKYYFGDPEDVLKTKDLKHVQSLCSSIGELRQFQINDNSFLIIQNKRDDEKEGSEDNEDEDESSSAFLAVIPFALWGKKKPPQLNVVTVTEPTFLQLFRVVSEESEVIFVAIIQHKNRKWEACLYPDCSDMLIKDVK